MLLPRLLTVRCFESMADAVDECRLSIVLFAPSFVLIVKVVVASL